MSLLTLALEGMPIDIAFSKTGSRLAVLGDSYLAVYTLDLDKRPIPKPSLLWRSDAIKGHSPRHVTFVSDHQLYILSDNWDNDETSIWKNDGENLLLRGPILETEKVSSLFSNIDNSTLYVQLQNGTLCQVDTDESTTDLPPQTDVVHKIPSFSPEVQVVHVEDQVRKTLLIH